MFFASARNKRGTQIWNIFFDYAIQGKNSRKSSTCFFYETPFITHIEKNRGQYILGCIHDCKSSWFQFLEFSKGRNLSCFLQRLISQIKWCYYRLGNIFHKVTSCLTTIALSWQVVIRITWHLSFFNIFLPYHY